MSNEGAKKKGKALGHKIGSKRKSKRRETYAVYLYNVLKQVSDVFMNNNDKQIMIVKETNNF